MSRSTAAKLVHDPFVTLDRQQNPIPSVSFQQSRCVGGHREITDLQIYPSIPMYDVTRVRYQSVTYTDDTWESHIDIVFFLDISATGRYIRDCTSTSSSNHSGVLLQKWSYTCLSTYCTCLETHIQRRVLERSRTEISYLHVSMISWSKTSMMICDYHDTRFHDMASKAWRSHVDSHNALKFVLHLVLIMRKI